MSHAYSKFLFGVNSIASIITIPIISTLLAQAAVVYAQRRRKSQSLSVRQVFALADGGWSNPRVLKAAWPPWRDAKGERGAASSRFLWLATIFLLLCAVQQPLREALISTEWILVSTYADDFRISWPRAKYHMLGFDAEPYEMTTIPEDLIVQELMKDLPAFSSSEFPEHLWLEPDSSRPFSESGILSLTDKFRYGPWSQPGLTYFAAALPNGTTTGVLRHRLMRLNSTVVCNELDSTDFPATCDGNNPFTASYTWDEQLNLRVCVPGQRGLFPWQNTRNRQDISEDAYLNVTSLDSSGNENSSFTMHCNAKTARGYFEMGNYRNNYVHGHLLDQWEDEDPYPERSEYNDWLSLIWRGVNDSRGKYRRPTTEDKHTDIPGWPVPDSRQSSWPFVPGAVDENRTVSGPLMTSMVALFGERSLIASTQASNDSALTASQICQSNRLPFGTFIGYDRYDDCKGLNSTTTDGSTAPGRLMRTWLRRFNDNSTAERMVSASVFFANQAMLLETVQKTKGFTARPIGAAPGETIQRPTGSLADLIVISVFVLLQFLGLLYLASYIYSVPTWTDMLDALAVARITSSLEKGSIPGVGSLDSNDINRMSKMDGLVGVVDGVNEQSSADAPASKSVELGLGASGLFHRRLAKFRMRRYPDHGPICRCKRCDRRRADTGNSSEETMG